MKAISNNKTNPEKQNRSGRIKETLLYYIAALQARARTYYLLGRPAEGLPDLKEAVKKASKTRSEKTLADWLSQSGEQYGGTGNIKKMKENVEKVLFI